MPQNAKPYDRDEILMAHGTRPFFILTQKRGGQTIAKSAGWATLTASVQATGSQNNVSMSVSGVGLEGIGSFSAPNEDGVISVDMNTELRLFPRQALGRRWLKEANNPELTAIQRSAEENIGHFVVAEPEPERTILERLLGRRLRPR
jgi:hypothetical protein